MKRIINVLLGAVVIFTTACLEDDSKKPFDYTAVYFPHQKPLRTVTTQDSTIKVGVVLGGKRDNKVNEYAYFSLAPELLDDQSMLLPSTHYKMDVDEDSLIKIPSGSFQGDFSMSFTADFYNDANAVDHYYILPLKIDQYTTDSVLYGKHYTMIKVKYINEYHGTYYRKGADGDEKYRSDSLVKNTTVDLTTSGTKKVILSKIGGPTAPFADKMELTINEDNSISAQLAAPNADLVISNFSGKVGETTGVIFESQIIYSFDYTFETNATRSVKDTLIFRDNGIRFETWD